MRSSFASSFLLLLLMAFEIRALDISGAVVNKLDQPIPLAQVCLKANSSRCVTTTVNGAFRITDAGIIGVAPARAALPYSLEPMGPRLALNAPGGAAARIAWQDASGRSLAPERGVELRSGRNLIPLPGGAGDGLRFLRIELPGLSLSWRVLQMGGSASAASRLPSRAPAGQEPTSAAGQGEPARRSPALSKAALAPSDLLITKTGFKPATYRPLKAVETDAYVSLTALSDSGFVYTTTYQTGNTIDRAKGQWITVDTVPECNGPIAIKSVERDTSRFAVRDGKLYQYYQGDCMGTVLTGDGDDVVGTWRLSEYNAYLPADLRPATCKDTVVSSPVPPEVKGEAAITETTQSITLSAEICPTDFHLQLIAEYLLTDPTSELTRNTCRQVGFTNGDGKEATLAYSQQGDSLFTVFTADTLTCRTSETLKEEEAETIDCLSPDPVLVFLNCLAETKYFGDLGASPLPKSAAGFPRLAPPMSRLQAPGGAATPWLRFAGPAPASAWKPAVIPRKGYISQP